LQQFIANNLGQQGLSTNILSQLRMRVCNKVCRLLIRIRNKGLKKEVGLMVEQWSFDRLFYAVRTNYYAIIAAKTSQKGQCSGEEGCSWEFCNEDKPTLFDEEAVDTLINLLTVVYIAADLREEGVLTCKSPVLDSYSCWRRGERTCEQEEVTNIFKVVHRI
jgi:hypothetical protein